MLLHAILLLLGSLAAADSPPPCDKSLIDTQGPNLLDTLSLTSHSGQLHVKCAKDSDAIRLGSGPGDLQLNLYASLKCDASKGWTAHMHGSSDNHYDTFANATSNVSVLCYNACDLSSLKGFKADEIKFSLDKTGEFRHLSCAHRGTSIGGIIAIDGDRERQFEKMECRLKEWTASPDPDEFPDRQFATVATHQLNFSCAQYCAVVSDAGLRIRNDDDGPLRNKIACADWRHTIHFNGENLDDDSIACGIYHGWTRRGLLFNRDNRSPQRVECKKPTQDGKRSVRAMRIVEGKQEE